MSNIKKAYTDIVELLQANPDASVSAILPQVLELASAKSGGGGSRATTFHKNDEGVVIAIKCYYFGKWMSPLDMEFGKKASSATGFNSMCKEGVSHWTKQQRAYKQSQSTLLKDVADGTVAAEDLAAVMVELEEARDKVEPMSIDCGHDTLEELLAAIG